MDIQETQDTPEQRENLVCQDLMEEMGLLAAMVLLDRRENPAQGMYTKELKESPGYQVSQGKMVPLAQGAWMDQLDSQA